MPENRTCHDCGDSYIYDVGNKKGTTADRCASCTGKKAREETKQAMLVAAGGGCRRCGYHKTLSAITFVDPIARLTPVPAPKNREEKIEWATQRVALCLNCQAEVNAKAIKMYVKDAQARPPKVFFATDIATIIEEVKRPKKQLPSVQDYVEVEVIGRSHEET